MRASLSLEFLIAAFGTDFEWQFELTISPCFDITWLNFTQFSHVLMIRGRKEAVSLIKNVIKMKLQSMQLIFAQRESHVFLLQAQKQEF
jgi:hypothetical protein